MTSASMLCVCCVVRPGTDGCTRSCAPCSGMPTNSSRTGPAPPRRCRARRSSMPTAPACRCATVGRDTRACPHRHRAECAQVAGPARRGRPAKGHVGSRRRAQRRIGAVFRAGRCRVGGAWAGTVSECARTRGLVLYFPLASRAAALFQPTVQASAVQRHHAMSGDSNESEQQGYGQTEYKDPHGQVQNPHDQCEECAKGSPDRFARRPSAARP
jgi:hypothetical protein